MDSARGAGDLGDGAQGVDLRGRRGVAQEAEQLGDTACLGDGAMRVCACMHMHACVYACVQAYVCACVHACMHV